MIATLRLIRYLPFLALAAVVAAGFWLFSDWQDRAATIAELEAVVQTREATIRTMTDQLAAAEARRQADVEAIEEELDAERARAIGWRRAHEALDGLEDGSVAPVLRGALDALP